LKKNLLISTNFWTYSKIKNLILELLIIKIKFVIKLIKMINLEQIIWKEGKHFVAQCLNVDVSSFGETKIEALENLKEALELYFEDSSPSSIQEIEHLEII
jgi:predicted RNase H-like HicB family nuclease